VKPAEQIAAALTTSATTETTGLPLPPLLAPMPAPSLYYVVTPIDARGRVADRSPIRFLGWPPNHPIVISVAHQAIVITHQIDGTESITRQGHLRLPARIRHLCRTTPGDRLLVAAAPDADLIVVYTMAHLESILLTHHVSQSDERQ
jgi:hypothetical protein